MSCNRIIKPEFTKEQIIECGKCKYASAKVAWCGLFGVRIVEIGKIIIPNQKYPSMVNMAGTFAKSTVKQVVAGNPKRSDEETARIILICESCEHYNKKTMRCYKCGCRMKRKIPWLTTNCPIGKW